MPDRPGTPTEEFSEVHDPIAVPPEQVIAAPTESTRPGMTRRRWLWLSLALLLLLGLGMYFLWPKITGTDSASAAAKAAKAGPPPIPVIAAIPRKGDIGVYYSGLGAITPLATVTVGAAWTAS